MVRELRTAIYIGVSIPFKSVSPQTIVCYYAERILIDRSCLLGSMSMKELTEG
jgi:hypothetical protein